MDWGDVMNALRVVLLVLLVVGLLGAARVRRRGRRSAATPSRAAGDGLTRSAQPEDAPDDRDRDAEPDRAEPDAEARVPCSRPATAA